MYKYLGVLLSKDLTWSHHVETICSKTHKILGLLYGRFYWFSNPNTIGQLYTSLVCPIWSTLAMSGHLTPLVTSLLLKVYRNLHVSWQATDGMAVLLRTVGYYTNLPTLERRRLEL